MYLLWHLRQYTADADNGMDDREGVDASVAPFVTSFPYRSQGVLFLVVFHRRNNTISHRVSLSSDLICPAGQIRAALV